MPTVLTAPIRPDQVQFVHAMLALNNRSPYAVSRNSGYQTSAESWGTGRAVARIPRVHGGGTHRAGQAAFGNMCRAGGMFAPTKIWRRWHRMVNVTQRRHAIVSALAGSAVTSLVMAKGHRVDKVPEIPLVVSNKIESIERTNEAVKILTKLGLGAELEKVKDSKNIRAGKGKFRNRRYKQRTGPLIVLSEKKGAELGFRNIPGVDVTTVDTLRLLQLAPGGHVGRMMVFSQAAIERLQTVYGSYNEQGEKKGYSLQRPLFTNSDLGRIINSNEIQSVLRPVKTQKNSRVINRNPLKNKTAMKKLNPAMEEVQKMRADHEAKKVKKDQK